MNLVSRIKEQDSIFSNGEWVAPPTIVYTDVTVAGQPTAPKYRNKYVVTVEFMYGDADGDGTEQVAFGPNQKDLLMEFLNFLSRCANAYPNGRCGGDDYNHVEGWGKWVDYDGRGNNPTLEWQGDPQADDSQASFTSAYVEWYDAAGIPFACNLVTE